MKIIGYITTAIVTTVLGSIWSGYVLSVLWRWFIVKPFGAPSRTIATAIGNSMVVRHITFQRLPDTTVEKNKSASEKMLEAVLWTLMKPAFALGFGAIVRLWV